MKKILLLLYMVSCTSAFVHAQIDPALAAILQQIVDDRVATNGDHGVSACVIMPNGDTWKGVAGVGVANADITDTTVFHGASTMKSNTTTLIMLLAEEGLIDLDESWDTYVDLDVNFDPAITVRQIVSNTSGIADFLEIAGSGTYVTSDFNHAYTPEEILEDIVSGVPDFAPGTDFWYSTTNFVLAALIAQTVTGNPVQDELRTRIWEPLGMTHTYFGGFENYTEPRAGVWWDFGSGVLNYSANPETSMLTYGFGGANMVSTPGDLAIFVRALLNGEIVSAASLDEMKVFSPDSYDDWSAGYGLGIHNAYAFGNNTVLGHDGYYTNMTDMFHSLDHGFTLVTMTNTQTQWFAIFNEMYNAIEDFIEAGTSEVLIERAVEIFPVPTSDHLTIHFRKSPQGEMLLNIYDMEGRIVQSQFINNISDDVRLDVSGLNSGTYSVGLFQHNAVIALKEFVRE